MAGGIFPLIGLGMQDIMLTDSDYDFYLEDPKYYLKKNIKPKMQKHLSKYYKYITEKRIKEIFDDIFDQYQQSDIINYIDYSDLITNIDKNYIYHHQHLVKQNRIRELFNDKFDIYLQEYILYYYDNYPRPSDMTSVPLKFWFNKDPGLSLPVESLQYNDQCSEIMEFKN